MSLDYTFDYDYDSTLYLLTNEPDAADWRVTVHSKDGSTTTVTPDKFNEYPGCEKHNGKTAWYVDQYEAVKVEIVSPAKGTFFLRHPNLNL